MEGRRIKEQSVSYASRSSGAVIKPFIPHQSKLLIDSVSPSPCPHTVFFFSPKCKALLMHLCNDINGSIRCERRREPINAHRGAQKNPPRDNNIYHHKEQRERLLARCGGRHVCKELLASFFSFVHTHARTHTHSHWCCCCCCFNNLPSGPIGHFSVCRKQHRL